MYRIVLGVFFLQLACVSAVADRFPLNAERILFLGDSITNAGYYIADIETQLRVQGVHPCPKIINLGLPSETCTGLSEPDHPFPRPDVHERLDRALAKLKPNVVVACYGMNDGIYYPFTEERFSKYQTGIDKLIRKVHATGAKIVLVTPPPFDPNPLKAEKGKLLPLGAEKYAWFAVYEDYDKDVMSKYAAWIRTQNDKADMVVDVYQPMKDFLSQERKSDPEFHVAADGVHMNEAGHQVLAKAILSSWGITEWRDANELRNAVRKRQTIMHDTWLSEVGHLRPGVKAGMSLEKATTAVRDIDEEISRLSQPLEAAP